jgi:hypothetical protein
MLRTRLTLKPGRPGTKRLVTQYGDRLICVRYRYDDERKVRCKTVELIVAEVAWPVAVATQHKAEELVTITIDITEKVLRDAILRLGGVWIPARNTCVVPFEIATLMNLTRRIVTSHPDIDGCE